MPVRVFENNTKSILSICPPAKHIQAARALRVAVAAVAAAAAMMLLRILSQATVSAL
jgi:hypothetical protein